MWLSFAEMQVAFATINKGQPIRQSNTNSASNNRKAQLSVLDAGCAPATQNLNLDVNNVRARILNGGDMWWDLVAVAKYEIPKVTAANGIHVCSVFAGALWLGGYDQTNLRLAAMTYRQNGSDFFPGPLDTSTGVTNAGECLRWDQIFQVTRQEVDNFLNEPGATPASDILNWPGTGNAALGEAHFMAPYVNVSNSGYYNPSAGDYPNVPGDQNLWLIVNDKGNIHSETKADPIGVEVRTLCFAFATNDQINDMTFYEHTVINRGTTTLSKTYFGQWVDPDLGYPYDDMVGCDTTRSMGYDYNGEDFDPTILGYGENPPIVGVRFFKGPYADPKPGVAPHTLGISKFMYYNNDFSVKGNPVGGQQYYNYLNGLWTDGHPIVGSNDGYTPTNNSNTVNYMFPGNPQTGVGWTWKGSNIPFNDVRFIESSGTFTLLPGATNNVTTGVVWSRGTPGGATAPLPGLFLAGDYAKQLYDDTFKLISGPDAPTMTIQELDKQLILTLTNTNNPTDNIEGYSANYAGGGKQPVNYKFEGYQIFQLANANVTGADLNNPSLAIQVAECDIKNGVTELINRAPDIAVSPTSYTYTEEVLGKDSGVRHSFVINQDAFSSTTPALINFKFYYFMVIAYARSANYSDFDSVSLGNQYLSSRKTILQSNLVVYTAIPHNPAPEFGGIQVNSGYGSEPAITRIEGSGNGGNNTNLDEATIAKILEFPYYAPNPTYSIDSGPITVKVIDPLTVQNANYVMYFIDSSADLKTAASIKSGLIGRKGTWEIYNVNDPTHPVKSYTAIGNSYEQIIPQWGLSVMVNQSFYMADSPLVDSKNGLIDATMTFDDNTNQWLTGHASSSPSPNLSTSGIPTPDAWIRSGSVGQQSWTMATDDAAWPLTIGKVTTYQYFDPRSNYSTALNGIIGPAAIVARSYQTTGGYLTLGPMYNQQNMPYAFADFRNTPSVDLVFTSDKTKWTHCVVIEESESPGISEGNARKFDARRHPSWTGKVDVNGNPVYDATDSGRSYFPGYAINIETGQRLNIIFGEESDDVNNNGADMIWNPTSNYYNTATDYTDPSYFIWGGKHWIYVMNSTGTDAIKNQNLWGNGNNGGGIGYDEGKTYQSAMLYGHPLYSSSSQYFTAIFKSAAWVMGPMLAESHSLASIADGIIPTNVKIRMRISKPYEMFDMDTFAGIPVLNKTLPYYTFSTSGIAATTNNTTVAKSEMDKVGIVPNPYYAYDTYENSLLDNRVRIINLPSKSCKISIYTLNGSLVRQFNYVGVAEAANSDAQETYLDWDLTNQAGIPIAGGVYIIYIDGGSAGSKVLKWFGVLRPIDLGTF